MTFYVSALVGVIIKVILHNARCNNKEFCRICHSVFFCFQVSGTLGSDSSMSDVSVSNMKRLFTIYSLLKFIAQKEVNYNGIYIDVPTVGR